MQKESESLRVQLRGLQSHKVQETDCGELKPSASGDACINGCGALFDTESDAAARSCKHIVTDTSHLAVPQEKMSVSVTDTSAVSVTDTSTALVRVGAHMGP